MYRLGPKYVTMRITFNIPEFTRNERNSHCDVLHITPVRVARRVLDDAIKAYVVFLSQPHCSTGTEVRRVDAIQIQPLNLK